MYKPSPSRGFSGGQAASTRDTLQWLLKPNAKNGKKLIEETGKLIEINILLISIVLNMKCFSVGTFS